MAKRFLQKNFYTFSVVSLGASGVSGWLCLNYIQDQQRQHHKLPPASVLGDTSSRIKSREELRLQAMVENALESSWRENMSNAIGAQDRFMGYNDSDCKFMEKVDKRAEKLWKKQKKRQEKEAKLAKKREESPFDDAESTTEEELPHEGKIKGQTKINFWGSK